jgi:hypothetical protein
MIRRSKTFLTLIVSLIMLVTLAGISCLIGKSESSSLIDKAHGVVSAQMASLEEQKFEAPEPLAPLKILVGSVKSDTHRMGIGGGGAAVDISIGEGAGGMGLGGDGGGGGGGGGGG